MTNHANTILYVGVTSNLIKRVWEHKKKIADGFTKKYNVTKLVYFSEGCEVIDAIAFEKRLKRWNRAWKLSLIQETNPDFNDLAKNWDAL